VRGSLSEEAGIEREERRDRREGWRGAEYMKNSREEGRGLCFSREGRKPVVRKRLWPGCRLCGPRPRSTWARPAFGLAHQAVCECAACGLGRSPLAEAHRAGRARRATTRAACSMRSPRRRLLSPVSVSKCDNIRRGRVSARFPQRLIVQGFFDLHSCNGARFSPFAMAGKVRGEAGGKKKRKRETEAKKGK